MQSTRHRSASLNSSNTCRAEAPALHKLLRFGYSASPMLDLGFVREHMDVIEKMARDRGIKLDLGPFVEVDTERRKLITATEQMKAERNKANDIIGPLQKAIRDLEAKGQDVTDRIEQRDKLLRQMKESSDKIKRSDELVAKMDEALKAISAHDSEYSAHERPRGQRRGGQRGSPPLGRAAEIRFRAPTALGTGRSAREFWISGAR